jgi:hypothetical protein
MGTTEPAGRGKPPMGRIQSSPERPPARWSGVRFWDIRKDTKEKAADASNVRRLGLLPFVAQV